MKLIGRLKLKSSVMLLMAISILGAAWPCFIAYQQLQASVALSDQLLVDVRSARAAGVADMMHDGLRSNALAAIIGSTGASAQEQAEIRAETAQMRKTLIDSVNVLGELATSDELRRAAADSMPVIERYANAASVVVELGFKNSSTLGEMRQRFDTDFKLLEDRLETLSELVETGASEHVVARDEMVRSSQIMLAVSTVAVLALMIGFGYVFARSLYARLGAEPASLRRFAENIACGRLGAELDADEIADNSVAASMIQMRDQLRSTVSSIREGADNVAIGSVQIATGNQNLSNRTEQQAAELQQTAVNTAEMSDTVRQTADHARLARELAAGASAVATRGGSVVQEMADTMGEIQASSRKIADITNLIDSIAFQTNILALNAAVEAARAGEQGRGFAVVASEVRGLAQRSASAAKEIKTLIASSVEKVSAGGRLAANAGHTMQEIVSEVGKVNELIGEISEATRNQTDGIAAVSAAVSALDQGTQRNTALVEESAAAAHMLSAQAERLASAVGVFKLTAD